MRAVSSGTSKSLDKLLPDMKKLIIADAAKHRASAPPSDTHPGAPPPTKRALLAASSEASKLKRRAAIPVRAPVGKKTAGAGASTPGSASTVGRMAFEPTLTPTATPSKQSTRIAALAAAKHTPSASSPLKPVVTSDSKSAAASATKRRVIERAISDDSDIEIIEQTPKAPAPVALEVDAAVNFKMDIVDDDFGQLAPPRKKQRRAFIDDADDGGMVEERFVKYLKVRIRQRCFWPDGR